MTKTGAPAPATIDDHTESFVEWIRSHNRAVSIGSIVVVVAAGVFWLAHAAKEKKSQNASRQLGEAQQAFASGNMPLAESDLKRVMERYGGTAAATEARLLLAQVYYNENKPAEGLKVLQEAGNPGPLTAAYHMLVGGGLEQSGKEAEAAAEYEKAATSAVSKDDKAEFKADAARAYETAGKADEARRLWTEIAADEDSPLASEARLRLGELTAKVASGT